MPYAASGDARIHWRSDGDRSAPPVLLLNSIGTELGMWDDVAANLARDFHVLRTDARGHGSSQAPGGDYSMDLLADDALAVLDAAEIRSATVCGLSLGALVAARLAVRNPDRIDALVLCNVATAFKPDDWTGRARTVRDAGITPLIEPSLGRLLSESFRASGSPRVSAVRDGLAGVDPQGYAGCCMAIASTPTLPTDPALRRFPLLSIGGAADPAAPPEHAHEIARATGGEAVILQAAHLSAVEDPSGFAAAVRGFLVNPHPAVGSPRR